MKKIAIITLVAVLAISSLGVGLAKWFDTITIHGTVDTGSVDMVVVDYSGTWVYKIFPHEIVVVQGWASDHDAFLAANNVTEDFDENGPVVPDAAAYDGFLVAYAVASDADPEEGNSDDIKMDFFNLFPGEESEFVFQADALLHYEGSIPARLDNLAMSYCADEIGDWLKDLYGAGPDEGNIQVIAALVDYDPATKDITPRQDEELMCGTQVEYCDYIYIAVIIDIPQDGDGGEVTTELMNRTGEFYVTFDAVQWDAVDSENLNCDWNVTFEEDCDDIPPTSEPTEPPTPPTEG